MSHARGKTTGRGSRRESSPFRAAFDRARLEALGADPDAQDDLPDADAAMRTRPRFEVRIEKRRGRRADLDAWNRLGARGWELVSVTGRHAFFRRQRAR